VKEFLLRTVTGILLVVIIMGSILLGPIPMLIMILLIYGLGCLELFRLKATPFSFPAALLAASGALLLMGVYGALNLEMNPLWLILPACLWIVGFLWHRDLNTGSLLLLWIAIPLSSFIAIGWLPEGSWNALLPVAVIAMVWINDTLAYVTGSLLGKHHMTPKLSPGKTWEGFVGGMLFTMLSGWLFYHFTGLHSAVTWIAAGVVASLFSLAGDLFESRLKRKYHVKDSGGILPGHGGVLDRFDSLLFVAPAMLLLILLLQLYT